MNMNFDVKNYWENRYKGGGDSGWGSHNENSVLFKSNYVNDVIEKYNIQTICELGCGDGNQLKYFNGYKKYYGYDISPIIIKKCIDTYKDDENKIFYENLDEMLSNRYDLSLSLDVIYHLVEDELFYEHMENLFSLSNIVCIFSTNAKAPINSPNHLKNRLINTHIYKNFVDYKLINVRPFYEKSDNTIGFFLYKKIL